MENMNNDMEYKEMTPEEVLNMLIPYQGRTKKGQYVTFLQKSTDTFKTARLISTKSTPSDGHPFYEYRVEDSEITGKISLLLGEPWCIDADNAPSTQQLNQALIDNRERERGSKTYIDEEEKSDISSLESKESDINGTVLRDVNTEQPEITEDINDTQTGNISPMEKMKSLMDSIKKKSNKDNKEEQTEAEQHAKKDPPNAGKQSPKILSTEMGMMNAKEREEYNEIIGAEDLLRITDICDNDIISMNKIATTAEILATADLPSEWGRENEDEECRIQLGTTYPETKEHIAEMMNILRGMGIKNIGYHESDKLEHLIATGRAKLNILLKIMEEYRTKILKNLEKCRTMKTMALRESKDPDESIEDPSILDAWDDYDLKRTSQSTPGSGNFDQQRRRHNVIPEPSHHSQTRKQLISEIKDDINQTLTAQMEKMQNLFITELGKLNEKIIQNQQSNIEAHEHTNETIKQLKRQKTEERMQKTQVDVDRMYAEQEHISQVHFKQDNSKQTNAGKG